ncbi:hypothetical protein PMAYCL1PPCAC_24367, partial [Pristionchus mayeri]
LHRDWSVVYVMNRSPPAKKLRREDRDTLEWIIPCTIPSREGPSVTVDGIRWKTRTERGEDSRDLVFVVECMEERQKPWAITAVLHLNLINRANRTRRILRRMAKEFDRDSRTITFIVTHQNIKSDCTEPSDLDAPLIVLVGFEIMRNPECPNHLTSSEFTTMTLVIGGKKVYVIKELLAMVSPYFNTLFYKDFKESKQSEITLPDIGLIEFTDLLDVIYPYDKPITDENVVHLLKLADLYGIKIVRDRAERFLMRNESKQSNAELLLLAEKYRLINFHKLCISNLTTRTVIKEVRESKEFEELMNETKIQLLDMLLLATQ